MKLIVVLGIKEFQDRLKKIFNDKVPIFSTLDIAGHTSGHPTVDMLNWFSQGDDNVYSTLYFSFTSKENADEILSLIEQENNGQNSERPFHAFMMDVEKYV